MPVPGVLSAPPVVALPTTDIPNVVLTAGDGTSWNLTDALGSQVLLLKGATGLSLPPNTPYFSDTPAVPGALRNGAHDDPRAVFLPVYCEGNSRAQQVANLRQLQRTIHWSRGPCHLSWAEADGTRRYLDMTYDGGAEGNDSAENSDLRWELIGLNFIAENPYLYGDPSGPAPWAAAASTPFFPLGAFPIRLTSTAVFGATTIVNEGDVPAWPTWTLYGPASSLQVELNASTLFTVDMTAAPLLAGQVLTVTTDPKADVLTVVDDVGANHFGQVQPGFSFWALPIGTSAVSITVVGATSATKLAMNYRPQYLRV